MDTQLLGNHFTDSISYQTELTAKYWKMLGNQLFEKFNIHDLSIEEFGILDTLLCNPAICQRDLAKIILRDRANTGKLLDNLEKKGLVGRGEGIACEAVVLIKKIQD